MPFTTTLFIFFALPISVILYFLISMFKKDWLSNLLLVMMSLAFYSFSGIHTTIHLILFITVVYLMGLTIEKCELFRNSKLTLFILSLVLLLAYYKYGYMIYEHFAHINMVQLTFSDIVIPLGLSFIVFESISYLVDIYKKEATTSSYLSTLLFFIFFPKISQGPIVLWKDFSKFLYHRKMSVDLFYDGLERVMIGFAKKTIIADSLGLVVANIMTNIPNGIDRQTAILGMVCYFLQIYYDFSGYSDIAIGIAKLFGFEFKENFNYPYTATSLAEFWRRWHISLGTWFRNYIYIPLGGNRKNIYLNLFIVFFITGIWHGSTINFLIWGLFHAIFIMCERYVRTKTIYQKIPKLIHWLVVMIFVMTTWIIFMLPELWQVRLYFEAMLYSNANVYFTYDYFIDSHLVLIIMVGLIFAFSGKMKSISILTKKVNASRVLLSIKFLVYLALFIVALLYMINSSYSPFLYFQF